MDHAYIDEHGLVERYVKRRLTPADEQAFETHLLDCERCIADVEVANLLASSLQAAADSAPAADEHPTASRSPGPTAGLLIDRPWLAAAALAVVALGPAAMVYWTAGAPPPDVTSPLVRDDVQLLTLSPVRSADAAPSYRVRLGETPFPVVFLLEGRPEIVRNFLELQVRLQSRNKSLDCFAPGRGLMPASFHVVDEGLHRLNDGDPVNVIQTAQ